VIALYNPPRRGPHRIHDAFALLRDLKPASTPVVFARAVGREDEHITIETLDADPGLRYETLIIVGSSETRIVPRVRLRLSSILARAKVP